MKKIILVLILLAIAIGVLFKMDIKPASKDVIKEVKPSINSAASPASQINLPSQ